eukprot:scaffold109176_cov62-Phaeocystis_antarctica.AAC.2
MLRFTATGRRTGRRASRVHEVASPAARWWELREMALVGGNSLIPGGLREDASRRDFTYEDPCREERQSVRRPRRRDQGAGTTVTTTLHPLEECARLGLIDSVDKHAGHKRVAGEQRRAVRVQAAWAVGVSNGCLRDLATSLFLALCLCLCLSRCRLFCRGEDIFDVPSSAGMPSRRKEGQRHHHIAAAAPRAATHGIHTRGGSAVVDQHHLERLGETSLVGEAQHAVGHRPPHARVVRRLLSHQALAQPHLHIQLGRCRRDASGQCVARAEEERRHDGVTLAGGSHSLELVAQQASGHAAKLVSRHPVDPLEAHRPYLTAVAQCCLELSSRTPEREDGGRALRAAVEQQHRRPRHGGGSGEGDAEREHEPGRRCGHGEKYGNEGRQRGPSCVSLLALLPGPAALHAHNLRLAFH